MSIAAKVALVLVVIAAVAWIASYFIAWATGPASTYTYDRNPYRRWCVRCGQCQLNVCTPPWGDGWWEASGAIKDAECACHQDAGTAA